VNLKDPGGRVGGMIVVDTEVDLDLNQGQGQGQDLHQKGGIVMRIAEGRLLVVNLPWLVKLGRMSWMHTYTLCVILQTYLLKPAM